MIPKPYSGSGPSKQGQSPGFRHYPVHAILLNLSLFLRLSYARPHLLILANATSADLYLKEAKGGDGVICMRFTVLAFTTHVQGLRFLFFSTSLYARAVPNGNKRNELGYIVHVKLHFIHQHELYFLHFPTLSQSGLVWIKFLGAGAVEKSTIARIRQLKSTGAG